MFFKGILYSVNAKICDKLSEEYKKVLSGNSRIEALEIILNKYNNFSKLAELAEYSEKDIKEWSDKNDVVGISGIKKSFEKRYSMVAAHKTVLTNKLN